VSWASAALAVRFYARSLLPPARYVVDFDMPLELLNFWAEPEASWG
jgi:hypothetical protein